MTDAASTDSLDPDPSLAVDLMLAVARGAWPATDAARRDLFATLGLRSVAPTSEPVADGASAGSWPSPVDIQRLGVPFGDAVYASWSSHAGEFLGIDLHLYTSPLPTDPLAQRGHDRILALLSQALGAPGESRNDQEDQAREWAVGRWRIGLYHFARRDSAVMLGVVEAAISRRADDDATARQTAWEAGERP